MGYVAGPTILRWGRSRTPIGPSSPMSRDGCVDGCASSMRSAAADVTGSRISTCTISWAWFRSETSCTTFRGRPPECLVREPSAGNPLARFDEAGCGNGAKAPRLELTRLRGHLNVRFGGVHDGREVGPVHTGV